jgi:hypothetical protein
MNAQGKPTSQAQIREMVLDREGNLCLDQLQTVSPVGFPEWPIYGAAQRAERTAQRAEIILASAREPNGENQ